MNAYEHQRLQARQRRDEAIRIVRAEYGAMALTDIAEQVLRESGPKTPAELVVAIKELNYRHDTDPRRLIASLKNAARRYPGRFVVGDDGRWSANS